MLPQSRTNERNDGYKADRLAGLVREVADMFGIVGPIDDRLTAEERAEIEATDRAEIHLGFYQRGLSLDIARERVVWRSARSAGRAAIWFAHEAINNGGSRADHGIMHFAVRYGCLCADPDRPGIIALDPASLADVLQAVVAHERVAHQVDAPSAFAWRHQDGGE